MYCKPLTSRDRMIRTYQFKPVDRPPHFEQMFELDQEAFDVCFPDRTAWCEAGQAQKQILIAQCMEVYHCILDRFKWDALPVFWPWSDPDGVAAAVKHFGNRVLVGTLVGSGLVCIESIRDWEQFALDLFENPAKLHRHAEQLCQKTCEKIDRLADVGCEFIHLVHDVAYNTGPFCSPQHFREFVLPYMARLVERVKQHGIFCTVHSDGNLMPILDDILSTEPHALQSIDPMANMDIAAVRAKTYPRKIALMGNVRCDALQLGPQEQIVASANHCLNHCGHESGYIFSSSNTIFKGVPLENYELMWDTYWQWVKTHQNHKPNNTGDNA